MENLVIKAQSRTASGKTEVKSLRKAGRLPAVMYNSKGEATSIDVDEAEFTKIWKVTTPTTTITIDLDGKTKSTAFIKETQYDILSETNLHVDFHVIDENAVLTMPIEIQTAGNPVGVRDGGMVEYGIKSIKIKCLPKDLPARMVADISNLGLEQQIRVKDLSFAKNVTVLADGETIVAQIRKAQ